MIGSRGQHFTVLQLLQGGVIAMAMLAIVYGVVQYTKDQTPKSDVYSMTCEILGSAYAARGTGQHLTRKALLVPQEITSRALVLCSGLPSGTAVNLHCRRPYCVHEGEQVDYTGDCDAMPCSTLEFLAGETITVCASCDDDSCSAWFGESEC